MSENTKGLLKAVGVFLLMLLVFGSLGIWFYNQYFKEPSQDPMGTVNTDTSQPPKDDDGNIQIDPDYNTFTGDTPSDYLEDTEKETVDNIIKFENDSISIQVGANRTSGTNDGTIPINPVIKANDESRFIIYVESRAGYVSVAGDISKADDLPNETVLLARDEKPFFYKTSYVDGEIQSFSWCAPTEDCESDYIKIRVVGYNNGKFYGTYKINIINNSGKYEFSGIEESTVDDNIRSLIESKLPDILSDDRYGVSTLNPDETIYIDEVSRLYFGSLTKPNGWEYLEWNSIEASEYPIYAAVVNFSDVDGLYFIAYFNKNATFIGYYSANAMSYDDYIEGNY